MPRRVSLPTADDLFPRREQAVTTLKAAESDAAASPRRRSSSGRVRHDEKMTVYVTADELLDIEHARLDLRRHHALGVDRGRIVRAAIAMALADLDAQGEDSALVRRLREA